MILSVNELQGTLLKAARGTGLPLGLAEDLAFSAADIATRDTDQIVSEVLTCLSQAFHPATADLSAQGVIMGQGNLLVGMPSALDLVSAGNGPVLLDGVPKALTEALIAGRERFESRALWYDWVGPSKIILHAWKHDSFTAPMQPERVEVDPQHWADLQSLAAKTYVPESEASRIAGAGAGLTDND